MNIKTLLAASLIIAAGMGASFAQTPVPLSPKAQLDADAKAAAARYESDKKLCSDETQSAARLQCRRDAKTALYEQFARAGKGLSNPKRLELLDLLAQGEYTVDALATAASLGLSTTSMNLQALKDAGLVRTRREGTFVHYRLAGDDVAALLALLRTVATTRLADADRAAEGYLGASTTKDSDAVARDELLRRVRADNVVVLDVRPTTEYAAGHIPGAVSIPLDELEHRLGDLPADIEIVAYCRGAYCVLAYDAVDRLTESGRTARRLYEGMLEWRLAGLPVEEGVA